MRYHVVVTLGKGYIVHFYGPYHGASNDLNLLKDSGFMKLRRDDEWTLGDGIYSCIPILLIFSDLLQRNQDFLPHSAKW